MTPKIAQQPVPEPFQCPDCGSTDFWEGPHGGLSVNFCCIKCGARFNDMVMEIQRTDAEGHECESFPRSYSYRLWKPRTNKLGDDHRRASKAGN